MSVGLYEIDDPDGVDRDALLATARRGTAITLVGQAAKLVLQLGSVAVLARLLAPADFGVLAMVSIVSGFVVTFSDMGLAAATIQRDRMTHPQLSTLFWINGAAGFVLALGALLLAPALAWFFREPRLTAIASILAVNYLLAGLAVQHRALLTRRMQYGALAAVEIIALIASIGCAVAAATQGLAYWSLVVQQVALQAVLLAGLWIASGWRPGPPKRDPAVSSLLSFAGFLTGFNVVNYAVRNMDNLLIGWRWGASPLGLYEKAYSLLLLPIQVINGPLTTVTVPTLSRLRTRPDEYVAHYQRAVYLMVTLSMPMVTFAFVAADDLVLTLLGPSWVGAGTLFRALAPGALLGTFNVATGWVYQSLGTTSRQFRFGSIVAVVMVIAFVVGLSWGPLGVAIAFSVVTCALRYPGIVYCFRGTPLDPSDLAGVLWKPLVAAFVGGTVCWLSSAILLTAADHRLRLVVQAAVFFAVYSLVLSALPSGRSDLREALSQMTVRG